jgi:hypothetical protein
MSKAKTSGQSDASRKLGQNSTVGQTVANLKKSQEAAQKAELKAQVEGKIKEEDVAVNYQQHAKQKVAQTRTEVVVKEHVAQLIQQAPPKSLEQLERERRTKERQAMLNQAMR